jgi:hypothetical protein
MYFVGSEEKIICKFGRKDKEKYTNEWFPSFDDVNSWF